MMKLIFMYYPNFLPIFLIPSLFLFLSFISISYGSDDNGKPVILDSNLKVQPVIRGLEFPTTMAFLGPNDMLVLEKEKGTVQRITDGKISKEPLLDVGVSHEDERGMLGIAVVGNQSINPNSYVFLYYTKSQTRDDDNIVNSTYRVSNYLYRYELVNETKLAYPRLLLMTPPTNASWHNGGDLIIGPDNNVYLTIGDLDEINMTQAQNIKNGMLPDIASGILRITQDGEPVKGGNILGDIDPLNKYYAYGIRNSFGIDFDPVTGKLWETENGPDYGDEINLVEPGFNGGWSKVQGIWEPTKNFTIGDIVLRPNNLEDFNGKGKYSAPEFMWKNPDCLAAIKFLHSDKYGKGYKDDLFVGTATGNLYHFDLNKNRTALSLNGSLTDKVVDTDSHDRVDQILFGKGFGGVTDMQVGPYDGLLYLVSPRDGAIYKIIPKDILNKD